MSGLIIGIGTTADSFVVYFERIKDLIHQGSSVRSAVPRAWKRARTTIITGNVVSIVASLVLYFVAVGDVKGFAFTLGLSTLVDVLVAFLVTAPLVTLMARSKMFRSTKWNGLRMAFRVAERKRLVAATAVTGADAPDAPELSDAPEAPDAVPSEPDDTSPGSDTDADIDSDDDADADDSGKEK